MMGMDHEFIFETLRSQVNRAIEAGKTPGAVLAIGTAQDIHFCEAMGHACLFPDKISTTLDTLYDLASLTKPMATAPAILRLEEEGAVHLEDPVTRTFPELSKDPRFDQITVTHLLTHFSGLSTMVPVSVAQEGMPAILRWASTNAVQFQPGETFLYSDVNYILLAELVRRASGQGLDAFSSDRIFRPLGMLDATFRPQDPARSRCAPTWDETGLPGLGEVHDPVARALGGVAGHAGLFATVRDVARFCQAMLRLGEWEGHPVLSPQSVLAMVRGQSPRGGMDWRGLGWDLWTPYSSLRGDFLSPRSFGHTGFTGTSIWIDPDRDGFVCLLTNRVHSKGDVIALRRRVSNMASFVFRPGADAGLRTGDAGRAYPGIQSIAMDEFRPLAGMNVGLITHEAALDPAGQTTLEIMGKALVFRLIRVFTPEHGLSGVKEGSILDGEERRSGMEVVSLYGNRKRPTPEDLEELDILVYDLQDIGARFYTYLTTLGYCMEEAVQAGIPFMVLDRPNPITGLYPEGPVLDPTLQSFVGYAPIPIRHGMTAGELAELFRREKAMDLDLRVIRCQGWRRYQWFDETGLLWRNPSPNMRTLTAGLLYPGICLLERTRVSVGRGTSSPFERVGAPWISGSELAFRMNRLGLPGVRFHPVTFVPESDPCKGQTCQGVHVLVTQREAVRPVRMGCHLFATIQSLWPDSVGPGDVDAIAGIRGFADLLASEPDLDAVESGWRPDLARFLDARADLLLY